MSAFTKTLLSRWYFVAALGVLGLAAGTHFWGSSLPEPEPTKTAVVTDADGRARCRAYWLDMRPADDDWPESITDQYVGQIDRMCAQIVADSTNAFAPRLPELP